MRKRLLYVILCVLLVMTNLSVPGRGVGLQLGAETVHAAIEPDYKRINLDKAWESCTGKGVNVALLDTGVNLNDSSIKSNIKGVYNAFTGSTKRSSVQTSKQNHGLSCAKHIVSMAPNVNLYIVKAADDNGNMYSNTMLEGIRYAQKMHCRVVNISYLCSSDGSGADSFINELRSIINSLVSSAQSGLVCGAVGNSGKKEYYYPASFDNTLSVGGAKYDSGKKTYAALKKSTYNSKLDVLAPGTSSSAGSAYACGIAALLFQADPSLTATECQKIIQSTAKDIGTKGKDPHTGYGLIQPYAAVRKALSQNTAIKMSKNSVSLKTGKYIKLSVAGTNAKIKWSSSNTSVATVSSTGKVTAKKAGKATIKAVIGGGVEVRKCNVTVTK